MSKMPAKKKSCFQITSVTQAQVAGLGAADDTESLDDPDESRTEDVSSEIYDMSRAEYDPACDISSSEEALNNVGEPEAISSVMAPSHIPLAVQSSNNPVGEFRKVGVSGSTHGGQQQPPPGIGLGSSQPGAAHQQAAPATGLSVNASQPAAVVSPAPPPATSTVSCTSRFRVIKLDHGTGEPFRRGRWTCTEFYEKDSDGNRTVDSIRHAGGATTLDPAADRDSGLGHTGGGAAPATHSGQGLGSTAADASLAAASRVHSAETQQPQQILHQNYMARPHSGSTTQSSTAVPVQPTVAGSLQPPQSGLLPVGLNGLPQSGVHLQKSPVMPPSAQLIAYPPQQLAVGQHLSGQTHNQTEYYQQPLPSSMQPGFPTGQVLPVGQGPGPAVPLTSGVSSVPSQIGDVAVAALTGPQPAGLVQQQTGGMGGVGGSMLLAGSTLQQQALGPYATAPTGPPQPQGLHLTSSGVQNVPVMAAGSTVPAAVPSASSSGAMPNVSTSSLPNLGQIAHHSMTPVVALGVQGLPAAGFGHVEGGFGGVGRLEGLFNVQSPPVGSGREPLKPLMPESLQLATPTVNSLFGIHIPVDGDVDRASGTNVAAIDNKIEQAMDLVKSHLMYAVREEVEVLKEQIKELYERNSVLERENAVLKSLANSEQLSQLPSQPATTPPQPGQSSQPQIQAPAQPQIQAPAQLQTQAQIQTLPKPQQLQTQPQLDPTQQQQQQQLQPNVTSA